MCFLQSIFQVQLSQEHQASLMQAEYAAKLQAAQLRLHDSEETSQRSQAHLRSKVGKRAWLVFEAFHDYCS